MERGSGREGGPAVGGGSGSHLGSRYVFSHVEELVGAAQKIQICLEGRAAEPDNNTTIIIIIHLRDVSEVQFKAAGAKKKKPDNLVLLTAHARSSSGPRTSPLLWEVSERVRQQKVTPP